MPEDRTGAGLRVRPFFAAYVFVKERSGGTRTAFLPEGGAVVRAVRRTRFAEFIRGLGQPAGFSPVGGSFFSVRRKGIPAELAVHQESDLLHGLQGTQGVLQSLKGYPSSRAEEKFK